ncbi:MAG: IS66 family insertion sequence element accessory protein TnpB [Candidatus Rifleibacteriota bacterium]
MISASNTPVFIAINPVDMRKSINGLSSLVAGELKMNPLSDGLFVFSNRTRKIIKILYWHCNGFCLWQKRLEKGKFKWPGNREEVMEVSSRELAWLVEGLDINKVKAHKQLNYSQLY